MIEVVPHSFFEDGRTLYRCPIAYDDDLVAWNSAKIYRDAHHDLSNNRDTYTCLR